MILIKLAMSAIAKLMTLQMPSIQYGWFQTAINRLPGLYYNKNNSANQMQVTTIISNDNLWSSQKYEIELKNITTKPLMVSLAEPFNPDLKAAYTKDGLSKVENYKFHYFIL